MTHLYSHHNFNQCIVVHRAIRTWFLHCNLSRKNQGPIHTGRDTRCDVKKWSQVPFCCLLHHALLIACSVNRICASYLLHFSRRVWCAWGPNRFQNSVLVVLWNLHMPPQRPGAYSFSMIDQLDRLTIAVSVMAGWRCEEHERSQSRQQHTGVHNDEVVEGRVPLEYNGEMQTGEWFFTAGVEPEKKTVQISSWEAECLFCAFSIFVSCAKKCDCRLHKKWQIRISLYFFPSCGSRNVPFIVLLQVRQIKLLHFFIQF